MMIRLSRSVFSARPSLSSLRPSVPRSLRPSVSLVPARQSRRKVVTCAWSRCPAGGRWLTEGSCPTCPRRAGAPSPTCRHRPRACRTWTPPWSPTPGCSPGRTPVATRLSRRRRSFGGVFVAEEEERRRFFPSRRRRSARRGRRRRARATRRPGGWRSPGGWRRSHLAATSDPGWGTATPPLSPSEVRTAGSSRWLSRSEVDVTPGIRRVGRGGRVYGIQERGAHAEPQPAHERLGRQQAVSSMLDGHGYAVSPARLSSAVEIQQHAWKHRPVREQEKPQFVSRST